MTSRDIRVRECPTWFQDELTRIGGVNPYGEPVFRMVWSTLERTVIGGRWAHGPDGYREVLIAGGEPCWLLMVWEPREMQGSVDAWEYDYRDEVTSYLQCGGYPKYGRYRLMQKFMHRELARKEVTEPVWIRGVLRFQKVTKPEYRTYRLEPCGLILDLMLPMLMSWRRLTNEAKIAALKQEEQLEKDKFLKKAKDARDGSRIRRGSQLVTKRAELIERGMQQTMRIASQTGLGMRIGA
jgi:hypothetical protein